MGHLEGGFIMRTRILMGWFAIFSLTLIACSLGSGSSAPTPIVPAVVTIIPATLPPLAPTNASNAAPTTSAIVMTPAPLIGVATATPVTGTDIITLTPTLEGTPGVPSEATAESTATQSPAPVSTGLLEFTVDVAGCRTDPTRVGGVILTMRFNPVGGNGIYRYFDDDVEKTQIYDRLATRGSGVIAAFRVESGDGQKTPNTKLQFKVNDYCH